MLSELCQASGHVCVGLDPIPTEIERLCAPLGWYPGLAEYCRFVVDATSDVASAYKLNAAFFEPYGEEGFAELRKTMLLCKRVSSRTVVILDAKRGDIGNSSRGYATYGFGTLDADAMTVSPYMGADSVGPFLENADRGAFILCRTSNPGAADFQDLVVGDRPLFAHIASRAAEHWNTLDNCGLVVGATAPAELETIARLSPKTAFLVPGVGRQGGNLSATVGALAYTDAFLINSTRDIMYPSRAPESRRQLGQLIHDSAASLSKEISLAERGETP